MHYNKDLHMAPDIITYPLQKCNLLAKLILNESVINKENRK